MRNKEQQIFHLREMAEYYRGQADEYDLAAQWAQEHHDKFNGLEYDHYGSFIQVKTPKREDLFHVLKAFPGKWDKSINDSKKDTLDYIRSLPGEVSIHCVSAPPPPSCQIVEEMVEIPAQAARREMRRVVKCTPDVEQATDEAAQMAAI